MSAKPGRDARPSVDCGTLEEASCLDPECIAGLNFLRAQRYRVPSSDALDNELRTIEAHVGNLLFGRDTRTAVQDAIARPVIPHHQISQRAYELYEQRGSVHGYDLDDWLNAERELWSRALETD